MSFLPAGTKRILKGHFFEVTCTICKFNATTKQAGELILKSRGPTGRSRMTYSIYNLLEPQDMRLFALRKLNIPSDTCSQMLNRQAISCPKCKTKYRWQAGKVV